MAGQVTIGRIAVKVYPDTKEFRPDLRRQLDAIEKGLKLKVGVELDERQLRREVNRVLNAVNSPGEAARRKVNFTAHLADEGIASSARRIQERIDDAIKDTEAIVDVDVNEEAMRRTRDKMDSLKDDYKEIDSKVQAQAETLAASRQLAFVARARVATLVVNVSKQSLARAEATLAALSGLRVLHSTLDNVWDLFRNLDKNIPIIGTIAEAALGLSAALLAAASNTFALARSLAQIGSVALLLPGLAGGFALGITAAVTSLSDFNKVLPDVERRFSGLQDTMSDAFWVGAEQPIRRAIDTLFPQFERGLENTSVLLGHWFGGLADSLRNSLDGSLDAMFTNLAHSIGIAAGANDAMATSIRVLGQYGAAYMPRLAQWWVDINNSFADWLTRADQSGDLWDWIEIGLSNLRSLGGVLAQTGRILAGIARAADEAGGSSLQSLHTTLRDVANTVNGEPFKSRLVNVLRAAHDAMASISEQAGPAFDRFFSNFSSTFANGLRIVGDSIGTLLDGVFTALDEPRFATGFLDFLEGLRDGIAALEPMWPSIGAGIGAIGTLAGTLASEFGPLIAQLLTGLADAAVELVPKIVPVIGQLADVIGAGLSVAIPVVEALASALGTLASSRHGIAGIVTAVVGLRVALAGSAIQSGLEGLLSLFGQEGKASALAGAIGRIATQVAIVGGLALGFGLFVDAVSNAGRSVPEVESLTQALSDLGDEVMSFQDFSANFAGGDAGFFDELFSPFANSQMPQGVEGLASALDLLDQSLQAPSLFERNDAKFLGFIDTPALQQAQDSIANLDTALAQAARSGNAERLADAENLIAQAVQNSGRSREEVMKWLPEYSAALDANRAAAVEAAVEQGKAINLQNDAMAQYRAAIQKTAALSPSLIDSINETSKTFVDLGAAMEGEALPSVDAWLSKLEEQVAAMTEWADNLAALAKKGVSEGVIAELQKLGPEGAPMVAQLVDASDKELSRLEEVMKAKTGGAVEQVGSEFASMNARVQAELQKLSPEAQAALEEMGVSIGETSRQAGQNVVNQFAGVAPGMRGAGEAVGRAGAEGIERITPRMADGGSLAGNAYRGGLLGWAGVVRQTGSTLGQNAVDGANGQKGALGNAGSSGGQSYGGGLQSTAGVALSAATAIAAAAVRALQGSVGSMSTAGSRGGSGYSSGMSSTSGAASAAGRALGAAAAAGAQAVSLVQAGINAAQGFIRGLQGAVGGAVSAAKTMASNAAAAVKKTLKIKSPSRVMREMGGYAGEGFTLGILDQVSSVEKAMQKIADVVSGTEFDTPFADLDPTVRTGRSAVRSAIAGESSDDGAGRALEVNFNAPVGGDPYEIARSIERRTNDALALEGLDL